MTVYRLQLPEETPCGDPPTHLFDELLFFDDGLIVAQGSPTYDKRTYERYFARRTVFDHLDFVLQAFGVDESRLQEWIDERPMERVEVNFVPCKACRRCSLPKGSASWDKVVKTHGPHCLWVASEQTKAARAAKIARMSNRGHRKDKGDQTGE